MAERCGDSGLREPGLLDSALNRPINAYHYANAAVPELAASYALWIAKNHPFVGGNKRVATVLLEANFIRWVEMHLQKVK